MLAVCGMMFGGMSAPAQDNPINPALKLEVEQALKEFESKGPQEYEIFELWEKSGASYIRELTAPVDKADAYVDEEAQRMMIGIYLMDMNYAAVFNREKDAADFARAAKGLIEKLGFQDKELTDTYSKLIDQARDVENISEMYEQVDEAIEGLWMKYIDTEAGLDLAVDGLYGWLVEGLYLATEVTAQQNYDAMFLKYLQDQMTYLQSMEKLLVLLSNYPDLAAMVETSERLPFILGIMHTIRTARLVTQPQVDEVRKLITEARNMIIQ
jgi:hypothetical protein